MNPEKYTKNKILTWSGTALFFIIGIGTGLYIGSYGALILLSNLSLSHLDACFLERTLIVLGMGLGIVYAVILALTGNAFVRQLATRSYSLKREGNYGSSKDICIKRHSLVSINECNRILNKISFLSPYYNIIESIVLVGSAAYGLQKKGSDTDIVIICKDDGYNKVREVVFQREIEEHWNGSQKGKIEFTVLSSEIVKREFQLGSPFSQSIRHGVILKSGGFIEKLKKRYQSSIPTKKYVIKALYEGIATQYFGALARLGSEIKKGHGENGACTLAGRCLGHAPADKLANVIMRMLYLTLPLRGFMPLTKSDVQTFVCDIYGIRYSKATEKVILMLRNETKSIRSDDYLLLKEFAAKLFREILHEVGITKEILRILKDASFMARGDFHRIQDRSYRNCVLAELRTKPS